MSKVVLSVCICIVALFLVLDTFRDQREFLISLAPVSVQQLFGTSKDDPSTTTTTTTAGKSKSKENIVSKEELSKLTGDDGGKVYLALVGRVFDVTKGRQHYGPGGGYHFFTGKDGTRGFVTGDFTEKGLIEDCSGLSHQDFLGLEDWLGFYHRTYKYVGKLNGLFYDVDGNPTQAVTEFEENLQAARNDKASQDEDMRMFPPCNSEYKQGKGRRLWCSQWSGGIERSWAGLPRQYFQPGQKNARCSCVKNIGPPSDNLNAKNHKNNGDLDNPSMKVYDGCDPQSDSCSFLA